MTPLLLAATLVAASVASGFAALLILSSLGADRRRRAHAALEGSVEPTVFLFDDRELVDATQPARSLLDRIGGQGSSWDRLVAHVAPRIPDFVTRMATLAETGEVSLRASGDPNFRVHAEYLRGVARLTLTDLSCEGQGVIVDALSFHALEDELGSLREILGAVPMPIWRTGAGGEVLWANQRYLALAADLAGDEDLVWPLPVLFDISPEAERTGLPKRLRPAAPAGRAASWHDCHSLPSGAGHLHFALPADGIVKAESALRDFVQTLTKTFAQLPIGLAIFDRQRQLTLFNPALMDLTALGSDYLSARPTLFSFLDRLRDARIIPEPKDYASWRQKMMNLEKAASSGQYEETWSLATGQTYRVSGRPHPDGAVAFLIEDITAEISLTRRFRSEVVLSQSALDALDEAIAVFSAAGDLLLSNTAYSALWQIDPGATLGSMSVIDCMRHWQSRSQPTPVWGDLRDFITEPRDASEWDADVTMVDGSRLRCLIRPIAGGATMISFRRVRPDRSAVHRARRSREFAQDHP